MNILLNWLRPYVLINDILKIIAYPVDKSKHIDKQKFKNIKTSVKNQLLTITTESIEDISLERVLFKEKADFFEEVFGIRPVLKQKKGVC